MQPFSGLERIMDMDAVKTDKLIASAIAALPYRGPSAGFSARVMAELAPAPELRPWQALPARAAGLIVTAWGAVLAFVSARFVYANLADIAAMLIQPGGPARAFNLLAAHSALALAKLTAAVSLVQEVMSAAAPGLPAWYEVTAA